MRARSQSPKEEGPWLWMTHEAFEQASKLGGHAVAVYSALAYFESRASAEYKHRFMVSLEELAKAAGFSRTTVCQAIQKLKDAGLIETVSGANKKHLKVRNVYRILSVSSSTAGEQRSTAGERHLSTPGERHLSTAGERLIKKKNSYSAGPQGPAAVTNKEEEGDARSPLRGGGAHQKTEEDLLTLTPEELRGKIKWARMRAGYAKWDCNLEEVNRFRAEQERFEAALQLVEEELTYARERECEAPLTGGGAPKKTERKKCQAELDQEEFLKTL